MEYRASLKERWKFDREVSKVSRYVLFFPLSYNASNRYVSTRHIPKPVYKAAQLKRTMLDARRVKEERRRKHTRAGDSKPKAERKKVIITEQS